jgi:hypothetical protein
VQRNAHHPNNLLIARVGDFLGVVLLEEALLVAELRGGGPLVAEPLVAEFLVAELLVAELLVAELLSRNPLSSIIEACRLALDLLTAQPQR